LHFIWPTVHSIQTPLVQCAGETHAALSCHWPLTVQVCGVSGNVRLQRGRSPGVQAQHSPPVHPSGQLLDAPQCPLLSHTRLVWASAQSLAEGTHSLQSFMVHATHVMGLPQLPLALHVSNVVPTQCVVAGVQSTQRGGDSRQTLVHTAPSFVHMPVVLQTCGCLPEQCWAPGAHGAQTPRTQTGLAPLHAAPSTHCPMLLQVRGVLLLQSLALGIHAPAHMLAVQTLGHTAPLLAQCPVVSQSCGCRPLQRVAPGVHSHAVEPTHAPVHTAPLVVHCALVLQVWGVLPLKQRDVPGVHTPPHEPPLQR
jgi:hypothetical protein